LLKAFLTWNKRTFRKTHNLIELGRACVKINAAFQPAALEITTISGWAVETRYPGGWNAPSRGEVENAIAKVHELHTLVVSNLPTELQS